MLCNVLWVVWRIQESLQEDNRWRDNVPYLCIVMYFIQYLTQTTSLYLLTCLSVERLYAVISPINYRHGNNISGQYKCVAMVTALVVASVCSTLNLATVLTMRNDKVKQTCRLSVSDSAEELLGLMVLSKNTDSSFHICPALYSAGVLQCSNYSALEKCQEKCAQKGFHWKECKRLNRNLSILFLSSLFILCCLAKPTLDAHMAVKVHNTGTGATRSGAEVIAEVVL